MQRYRVFKQIATSYALQFVGKFVGHVRAVLCKQNDGLVLRLHATGKWMTAKYTVRSSGLLVPRPDRRMFFETATGGNVVGLHRGQGDARIGH